MTGLTIQNISKQWSDSDYAVLKNIDLQVGGDEFLILLGPSGCGKSTLLRIISGLVTPTTGRILINGRDVTDLEPQERGIGMIFQNYALFPHMNIRRNLSFPLEIAHEKREKRNEVVDAVAELLDISRHLKKKPEMLSGGERQRVAMGRAMVKAADVLLFDEPLSNLDESMRARLRPEILRQFQRLQVPFVYVTHDQVDAMTMGTKIAVMDKGIIQHLGTPGEIYDRPANMFVASFVGVPKINYLRCGVRRADGETALVCGDLSIELPRRGEDLAGYAGETVILGIRPEDLSAAPTGSDSQPIRCLLRSYEYLGSQVLLFLEREGELLRMTAPLTVRAKVGEAITIYPDRSKIHLFDPGTGTRIGSG